MPCPQRRAGVACRWGRRRPDPHGRPYLLASDLSLSPIGYQAVLAGRSPGHITSWNGGGRAFVVSAAFTVDKRHAGMLLDILPPVVLVVGDADPPAMSRSLQQMIQELRDPQPGGRLIVEHLATTLLAQALRAYLAHAGKGHVGWLFALADKKIGNAIGAMHTNPAHRWTVQALAERAVMSRTSFAVRFKRSVGLSPMEYLTRLRIRLASDRLATSDDAISVVAEAFGYGSESAFSNAFKRHLGCSPRRFATRTLYDGA